MLHNSDELTRRTLSFPAVKPCKSISITTLFNSILSLSKQICNFKSPEFVFTSNKRNAKNALRLIQVLHLFLEGLQDAGVLDMVGKSVIASFLDLHVALQNLNFLLQDCTRQDARVWMLMNYDRVGGHFRALLGLVAASLDALPSDVISVCDNEVKDLGSFFIHQRKRVLFEAQNEDDWASNMVKSALGQFQNRVIPDPSELRLIMSYLDIKTWTDCNDQVKFLEEELETYSRPTAKFLIHMSHQCSTKYKPVAKLMGLMVYCRCVLFDCIDGDVTRVYNKISNYNVSCLNPDDIKCPISLEIMMDPVTISTGQTYDRINIIKWFKAGNPVCPKTGQRVQNLDLVPNIALKKVIKQYCLENGFPFPIISKQKRSSKTNNANYVADLAIEEATTMVADFLSIKLVMGTMAEKSKAAYEIRLLTKRSEFNRACFIESGTISYLLNLLLSKDSIAQENSMAALLNLSKHPKSKPIIVSNGGLTLVIKVLKKGIKMAARQYAAAILFNLSSIEEYRGLIGNNSEAIPSLVELIRVGSDQGKKNALVSIFSLLLLPSNHCRVLNTKLVPLLISLLDVVELSEDLVVNFLAVLAVLAEKTDGARAILRAKALDGVIRILCSSSSSSSRFVKEHCASLLLAMCINCGREVIEVLVKNTSLMGALYALLLEGTTVANNKASSLISLLHDFSDRSSSQLIPHTLPRENFIPVW
ncbi:U-box domain-containing protein 19 [Beta vulgaris subsp. vulgaris]|uniref:U-box domain-containing protein 19 n=1 Tax=Beta vulgaris subsp. vulgaris TaxID=3555 RepID=UPI002036E77A|nr:U-box domain-containing protein 19 [Beta vulgaris subsp. vulgaris]